MRAKKKLVIITELVLNFVFLFQDLLLLPLLLLLFQEHFFGWEHVLDTEFLADIVLFLLLSLLLVLEELRGLLVHEWVLLLLDLVVENPDFQVGSIVS